LCNDMQVVGHHSDSEQTHASVLCGVCDRGHGHAAQARCETVLASERPCGEVKDSTRHIRSSLASHWTP
jgi:hypothetical protein